MERDWSNLIGGRSAVVTGSGAGMGRAIAIMLARAGGEVWIADLDVERAERVVGEIEKDGGKAHTVVRRTCAIPESIAAMVERTGPVDILVNNAGSGVRGVRRVGVAAHPVRRDPSRRSGSQHPAPSTSPGSCNVTHRYLPAMIERGWGRILTIVSDAGRRGRALPGGVRRGEGRGDGFLAGPRGRGRASAASR